jgi:hypothetical protein
MGFDAVESGLQKFRTSTLPPYSERRKLFFKACVTTRQITSPHGSEDCNVCTLYSTVKNSDLVYLPYFFQSTLFKAMFARRQICIAATQSHLTSTGLDLAAGPVLSVDFVSFMTVLFTKATD